MPHHEPRYYLVRLTSTQERQFNQYRSNRRTGEVNADRSAERTHVPRFLPQSEEGLFFFFLLLFSQQFTRVAHPTAPIISEPVRRTHADRFFGPRPTSAVLWTCYSAKYVIMVQTVGYSQYFCRVLRIR